MKIELIAIRLQRSMQLMFRAGVYSLRPVERTGNGCQFDFHAKDAHYRVTIEKVA